MPRAGGITKAANSEAWIERKSRLHCGPRSTPATPVSVDFHFRDTDAAKVLKPKRLLGAAHFRGTTFTLGVVDVNPTETQ